MADLDKDSAEEAQKKSCFPIEPFALCGGLCFCLPTTWKKIQDCTHMVLVLGVISCIVLVLVSAAQLWSDFGSCGTSNLFCAHKIASLIFGFLLATYVTSIISQFDDQLMAKEEKIKEQKAKLLNSYNELLSDMDGLLTNATESASGLAERSFESKRRDFQRFLERAKSRFSSANIQADLDMLRQFRRFCVNWLNVFKECSIDPVGRPTDVVTEEELERQVTIQEVADLCLERLRVTEVRFISAQRDKDRTQLNEQQKQFKRQDVRPKMLAIEAGGTNKQGSQDSGLGELKKQTEAKKSGPSWLKCGGGGRCKCDTYPLECTYVCGSVQCLSRQHSTLLLVFGMGVALLTDLLYEAIAAGQNLDGLATTTIVLVALGELCALVLLFKFEELDVVQKLEREVSELKEQNQAVGEQRAKMKEFWSSAQNLTELWLYRTVPRLDLYKELHSQLEDVSEEDLLTNISGANDALENLENKLGALEYWRNDGALKTEDKKMFGKTVNEICQIGQFGEILMKLEDDVIHGPVMQKLKALPQVPSGARKLA